MKMIEIKKSVYWGTVIPLGILFLIFLFVRIDGLGSAKKNYKELCTETTWGTVTYMKTSGDSDSLMAHETVEYTFKVNGQTINGSYSATSFGSSIGNGANYDKPLLVHYNPHNVNQNYFGNHCEPVVKAETNLTIAIFHLLIWLVMSIAVYIDQHRFWDLEESAKILRDFRRYN